jgi:hypothetical protein
MAKTLSAEFFLACLVRFGRSKIYAIKGVAAKPDFTVGLPVQRLITH